MRIQKDRKKNRMLKAVRILFCLIFSFVFCLTPAFECLAEDEEGETLQSRQTSGELIGFKDGYSAVLYNNSNGLPTSEANDILQSDEGFLWIGSYAGLIRYDGNTFERMDSSTGITSVKCLFEDSRKRLWIGTNDNGVFLMENDKIRGWNVADGLKSSSVRCIAEDGDGRIFIGTTGGLTIFDADLNIQTINDPRLYKAFVHTMSTGKDGYIYGVTNDGDAFILKNGKTYKYFSHESKVHGVITYFYPDPENTRYVYLETKSGILLHTDYLNFDETLNLIETKSLSQILDMDYINGKLLFCFRNGIGVLKGSTVEQIENIPMTNSICKVISDYEGNLWFASSRQGIMKIVPNQFSDIFEKYNLAEAVVNTTCVLDSQLFIGTDNGLIVLNSDGSQADTVPVTQAIYPDGSSFSEGTLNLITILKNCRIRSIIKDSKDRLWISTWRSFGLIRYDHGNIMFFSDENGMYSNNIRMIAERSDGSIVAAVTGGVHVIKDDAIIASYNNADGITNTETLCVEIGKNGDILCGSDGGGIYILTEDGLIHIGQEEGLTSGAVMKIKYDEKHDVYWVVTGSCLAYLTSDYQLTVIDQFPYSNNFDLYENSSGEMWILSSNGIYVVAADVLLANKAINPLYYGISNGLPCIATANSFSYLTEGGNLYIAGTTGVTKVNIDTPYVNISDLKAAIPYIDADDVRIYPDADGNFNVGADVRKITIYSYVYNYSLINPQVTYRLKGFDRTFTTVRRSELGPITYTNLSGGTYRFVIQLVDQNGGGNKVMSVKITKAESLKESTRFKVLSFLGFLAVAGLLVSLYIRRRIRQLEKKHREENEKARMKTELHMAKDIQQSMLPHSFPPYPDRSEFDIYATMTPAREVGGDFYDFFLIDDDHLCLVIADVSGKGIPASLFMMISKTIVQSCAMLGKTPADILTKTNEALCSNNQIEMFVTVWLGILEISTGKLTAANAGHEYPCLMKNGKFECYKDKHGFIIGGMEDIHYTEYEIQMEPGDKIFVYTDGVPEASDAGNNMFQSENMLAALNKDPKASPKEILDNVRQAVADFVKDAEQFDDLTMLCMEYKGQKTEKS